MGLRVPEVVVLTLVVVGLVYFVLPSPSAEEVFADSLTRYIAVHPPSYSRVAISWNVCLDLIARGIPIFNSLGHESLKNGEPSDFAHLENMDQVLQLFTLYHKQGSAVERHVESGEVFDLLVNKAKNQDSSQYFAGGNAALMANGLTAKGSTVLLGGPVGETMKQFLRPGILFPETEKNWDDEIHLILEFKKEELWGGVPSPRANRMILTHDVNNIETTAVMKSFERSLESFHPDMLVVTGFHMLGSQDSSFRMKQVNMIVDLYSRLSAERSIPIHAELASMGSPQYWEQLLRIALPKVHSIGLNEQELFSAYLALGGKEFEWGMFTQPNPHLIISTIGYIFEASNSDVFQRVHFHCLHFHIVALRPTKKDTYFFPRSRGPVSVAAGSFTTTSNACPAPTGHPLSDPSSTDLAFPDFIEVPQHLPTVASPSLPPSRKVLSDFKKEPLFYAEYNGIEFWVAPILVCKHPKKTVGLGDSISSAGVAYAL